MLRIVVMNAKGGCGKTTVATNLASYCASQGYASALFDYDAQASSTRWLKTRPQERPAIHGVDAFRPPQKGMTRSWQLRIPAQTQYVIEDTPAGYAGIDLDERIIRSDVILIPVLPSQIDIQSTADFIRDLFLLGKVRARNKQLAIIANRTRIRTKSLEKLERFLQSLDIPVIGQVRDTQHYVRAAEQGIGVHELAQPDARRDAEPWAQILEWLREQEREKQTAAAPWSQAMPVA